MRGAPWAVALLAQGGLLFALTQDAVPLPTGAGPAALTLVGAGLLSTAALLLHQATRDAAPQAQDWTPHEGHAAPLGGDDITRLASDLQDVIDGNEDERVLEPAFRRLGLTPPPRGALSIEVREGPGTALEAGTRALVLLLSWSALRGLLPEPLRWLALAPLVVLAPWPGLGLATRTGRGVLGLLITGLVAILALIHPPPGAGVLAPGTAGLLAVMSILVRPTLPGGPAAHLEGRRSRLTLVAVAGLVLLLVVALVAPALSAQPLARAAITWVGAVLLVHGTLGTAAAALEMRDRAEALADLRARRLQRLKDHVARALPEAQHG